MDLDKVQAEAFALFDGEQNANQVAKAMGLTWYEAKKLRDRWAAERETVTGPASTEPEEEEQTIWDVTLKIPHAQAGDIFATFSTEEQMDAIANVLQNRLNVALGVVD